MTVGGETEAQLGVLQAALRWHAAATRGDCDWDAFTAWLEADAAHQQAYAHVAELEGRIEQHRPALRRELVDATPIRRRGVWPKALAAALLLALGLTLTWDRLPLHAPAAREYTAQSGARTVQLAAGARVTLAPGSRIRVTGSRQDHVDLTGSAFFDVPHDPRRTLVVVAAGYAVRDIGTRFEVFSAGGGLRVAVAEGSVNVDLPGSARGARVEAGQRLLVSGTPPRAEYASIAAGDVAGWREGRLIIRDEPLSLVAAQISLHAGTAVTVDAAVAQRRFSGVLAIGDGSQLAARLGEIMGLAVLPRGDGLHLAARDSRP
jgi:transmembrane sensor